jgi:hypothetical protein
MLKRVKWSFGISAQKPRMIFAPLGCAFALLLAGCFGEKRPAAHVVNVSLAHPVSPVTATDAIPDNPPDIQYHSTPLPSLGAARTAPPRPRVATPQTNSAATEKTPETMMLPELSPEQMAAAKTETQQSLDAAEGNLARANGRSLNPTQKDLESKARSFMDTAREAMHGGDLPRAQNFAKKAEVLSRELAASL